MSDKDGSGDVLWPLADNQGTTRDVTEYDAGTDRPFVSPLFNERSLYRPEALT